MFIAAPPKTSPLKAAVLDLQSHDFSLMAAPLHNSVLVGQGFISARHKPETQEFCLAHEVAHLKLDAPLLLVNAAVMNMGPVALSGAAFNYVLALSGEGSLMAAFASAAAQLAGVGLTMTATLIPLRYADRASERRADRNALYVTGDLDAALGVMKSLKERGMDTGELGRLEYAFVFHPSSQARQERLIRAWEKVVQCVRPAPLPPLKPIKSKPATRLK